MYKKYSEGFIMSEIISASASDFSLFKLVLKALKFTIISYVVSVIFLAALAVLVVYTDVPEAVSAPAVKGIALFGAFLSAFLTSKATITRGWLCGAFTGFFNIFLLKLLGAAVLGAPIFASANIVMMAGGALCGMIGGIIGVNFGNN